MPEIVPVMAVAVAWIGLLFLVALWAERAGGAGRRVAGSAGVYALAQAVYCTSWTYYGSVGFAASHGLLFLSVYLGPTLAAGFGWTIQRKLVLLRNRHRVTSLADLLSLRYGKSQPLAMLATSLLAVGLLPYLALQLKTLIVSVALLGGRGMAEVYPSIGNRVGPPILVLMIAFTIAFGIRRLSPTERHPGIMAALALESIVKLVGIVAVGVFATWGLFHGFGDLFRRAAASPGLSPSLLGAGGTAFTWMTHLTLSASAILFLPRQFQVGVVEITKERHLRTAMWLFPAYLLVINVFIFPLALAGLLLGYPPAQADAFVLSLPLRGGQRILSWLVFLGGFSAAAGMLVVETMALSTMLSNHVYLPAVGAWRAVWPLRRYLLAARWCAAALVLGAAFVYERVFGHYAGLASTGLTSFAAVLQLAPALLFGLYWRGASTAGAAAGIAGGFLVWMYTLVIPLMVDADLLPRTLLTQGPAGLAFLRPEALLGLGGLDRLSHAVAWSLLMNVGLLALGSFIFPATAEEEARLAAIIAPGPEPVAAARIQSSLPLTMAAEKGNRLMQLFSQYHAEETAHRLSAECLRQVAGDAAQLTVLQLAALDAAAETALASYTGVAAAHAALRAADLLTPQEVEAVGHAYADILATMQVSPTELQRKVDYHRQREELLAREAERERFVADLSARLGASLDLEDLAARIPGMAVPHLADAALLWLAPTDGQPGRTWTAFQPDGIHGKTTGPDAFGATPSIAKAIQSAQPLILPGGPANCPASLVDLGPLGTEVTIPFVGHARALGALSLFTRPGNEQRLLGELALATELARRAAVALENAMLFQSAREAVRTRDEFLAIASHEIKTPLTPLRLSVQMLRRMVMRASTEGIPPAGLDELVQRTERQTRRLVNWIDNLLDVSILTGRRLRLSREAVELGQVVREVVERFDLELHQAGCAVRIESAGKVIGDWDRIRIEQICTNLLNNAIKYAPGKPIEIAITGDESSGRLAVHDHGPGIAPADQERVFRAFERATSYERISGFGLGLFIVRDVVEAHRGTIVLDSIPGEGSTFTVTLPRRETAEPLQSNSLH